MEHKKEPSNTLIYVSNLPFDTNDEQFRELFKGFNIKTAYVARRKNGKSKGFGFVNLEKESDQNAAIEKLNGKELNSRKLIAKIAFNDDRRNEKGELKEEFKTQQNTSTPSETVLHVSNLEWTVKDEDLKKIFAEFNPKVATVAMRRNGRSKGFGFVEFNNKEDQEKALKLNGSAVSGRNITVQKSTGFKKNNTGNSNNRNNNRNDNRRNFNNNNRRNNNNNNNNNNNRNFNVVRRNERKSENTLYISNLPFELDDNDLKQIFSEFHPKNAHIPTRRNGRSKGYGFVEFNNSKDQNEALRALDQSEVNGRLVTIKVSTPNRVTVRRNVGFRNNNNNNRRYNDNNDNNNNNNNRRYNDNNDNYNRSRNRRDRNFNNNNRRNNNNNNNNNNNDKPKEVSTNMVYVSNLPFSVDDKGLEEIFKGLKLTKAYVAKRRNGYSKGFGFVEFATPEDQQKAIKQNSTEVNGRTIVVQAAFKVENKTN